jgi:hypothetical protein
MAAPTYATDLTLLDDAADSTGWTAVGGGGALGSGETDFFVEGSACLSKATAATWDTAGTARGGALYNNGAGVTIPTNGAFIAWCYWTCPNALDTQANGGMELSVGNSTTAYYGFYVGGRDNPELGGWQPFVCDPNETAQRSRTVGAPSGTWQYFGYQAVLGVATSIAKGNPYGIDVIRYGRGELRSTNGDSGNGYASFGGSSPDGGAAAYDNSSTRRWGLLTPQNGAYYMQGLFVMGLAGTAVDFRDSNRAIFIRNTPRVAAGFNGFEIRNASSRVDWTNINVTALGTQSRGTFVVTDNADVNLDTCVFTDMGTFAFLAGTAALNCTFRRTDAITAPGSTLLGSTVDSSRVAADASALIWNVATDPDGLLDDMTFIKGTNAHHAIQLGASAPATVNLNGMTFTGFNASNEQNDSVVHLADTGSNRAWTINAVGCTGTVSVKKTRSGDTYTVVTDPVTAAIHVQDVNTGAAITSARVLVYCAAGGGKPGDVTVTISRVSTTASVAHTAHGLSNGDKVLIKGANQAEYNGVKTISNVSTDAYDFTVSGSPTTPATGTIKASLVVIDATVDGSGNASDTRSWPSDQPITGRVRKGSASTYYKSSPITGSIDSIAGFSATIQMIPDA